MNKNLFIITVFSSMLFISCTTLLPEVNINPQGNSNSNRIIGNSASLLVTSNPDSIKKYLIDTFYTFNAKIRKCYMPKNGFTQIANLSINRTLYIPPIKNTLQIIDNFYISNCVDSGVGILINKSNITIKNTTIRDVNNVGIQVGLNNKANYVTLDNCRIINIDYDGIVTQ